jgi:hypothetical protein
MSDSFDLPTPPPALDPEWLTFLDGLPIGTDEEGQLYNHNLELIAAFIVAHKSDDPEPMIRTLAFRLARNKVEQILLDRTPHFLAFRSALATFDEAYGNYTQSIRDELWQLIEEIQGRGDRA